MSLLRHGFNGHKEGLVSHQIPRKNSNSAFLCRACRRHFSAQTVDISYRHRRPELNRLVYSLLASSVSQRRTARLLGTTQVTVARKLLRIGAFAAAFHNEALRRRGPVKVAVFDEMETFEHSKCKPVAIAVAVEEGSRWLIQVKAAKMPAKGPLAGVARRRYGYRPDHRRRALTDVLTAISIFRSQDLIVKSDRCPRYPRLVKALLPGAIHQTFKGRRACIVGLGELKAGGFDPLFSLNHTCAMVRDNTKRLGRKTWCTTKRIDRLQCLLDIYVCSHNENLATRKKKGQQLTTGNVFCLEAGASM